MAMMNLMTDRVAEMSCGRARSRVSLVRTPGEEQREPRREPTHSRTRGLSRVDGSRSSLRSSRKIVPEEKHDTGWKMELPVFEGDDAYGWLNKVERYFRLSGVQEDEQVSIAMVAMEGRALNWFQWWEEQAPAAGWPEFREALLRRFRPGLVQNPFEPLLKVKQSGSVMDYREKFESVIGPLKSTEPTILKGVFLNGLKEEIRAELKLYRLETLAELMDTALLLEEKNIALAKGTAEPVQRGGVGSKYTHSFRTVPITEPFKGEVNWGSGGSGMGATQGGGTDPKPPDLNSGERKGNGARRLCQAELQERSRKWLCFKCGEVGAGPHL